MLGPTEFYKLAKQVDGRILGIGGVICSLGAVEEPPLSGCAAAFQGRRTALNSRQRFDAAEIFSRSAERMESNSGEERGLSFQSMNVCCRDMKNARVSSFDSNL